MNHREWIDRLSQFIGRFRQVHPHARSRLDLGPPTTLARVAEAERAIGRALPHQFREFLISATGNCSFGYWWEPTGEAEVAAVTSAYGSPRIIRGGLEWFGDVASLADQYEFHRELVEDGSFGDNPLCRDPLPIGGMGNGDHVAIDLVGQSVIFLAHDEGSFRLAPDFDSFLRRWEAIGYLDFDMSPYERFVDRDGGGDGIDLSDDSEVRRLLDFLFPGGRRDRAGRA